MVAIIWNDSAFRRSCLVRYHESSAVSQESGISSSCCFIDLVASGDDAVCKGFRSGSCKWFVSGLCPIQWNLLPCFLMCDASQC